MANREKDAISFKSFLFKTQITRKVSFSQYLFTYKNLIALAILIYMLINYGEDYFVPSIVIFFLYIYSGYKKNNYLFDFKINKRETKHLYYFIGKIKKEVVRNKHYNQTELLFADLFLNQ